MGILFQTIYSCAPPFIQYAGISALKGNQDVIEERLRQYKKLRDLIVQKLNEIPGVSCVVPGWGMLRFPKYKRNWYEQRRICGFCA